VNLVGILLTASLRTDGALKLAGLRAAILGGFGAFIFDAVTKWLVSAGVDFLDLAVAGRLTLVALGLLLTGLGDAVA